MPIGGQAPLASRSIITINGLGDSITAQPSFQSSTEGLTTGFIAPTWTTGTAYAQYTWVQYQGAVYLNGTAGTSSGSTGPTGDTALNWTRYNPGSNKTGTSFLVWAEIFSAGRVVFNQETGSSGFSGALWGAFVKSAGTGYKSTDTVTFGGGATASITVNGSGSITGCTVTNPGTGGSFIPVINTTTGSGGSISPAFSASGTFGVSGCQTSDMVARLPACVASSAEIFTVHGGTNDVSGNQTYPAIIANLRTCYETLVNAGKYVVAIPITPRDYSTFSLTQTSTLIRVNKWIRAYSRKEAWATGSTNPIITPFAGVDILLADPTGYYTDGTTASNNFPIGLTGGVSGAMTQEGLHPSHRGAMYFGYCVWTAIQAILGQAQPYNPRIYVGQADGADIINNPGGNLLEGLPWKASTAYQPGQVVSNVNGTYKCMGAGTSAATGTGPTGTGYGIGDGSVTWFGVGGTGMSVMASTPTALTMGGVAASGITVSGNAPGGYTLTRNAGSGSTAGTIASSVESPWSNGQIGQRWVLAYSLGSGNATDQYTIGFGVNNGYTYIWSGFAASDLGTSYVQMEAEVELSNVANLSAIYLTGFGATVGPSSAGAGYHLIGSANEMIAIPNGGKLILKSQPLILPSNTGGLTYGLSTIFDASGAAGSATATIKINYLAVRRAYVG